VVAETGELKFNLGNILVFILKTDKLLELALNNQTMNRLYHKAFKKIAHYDAQTRSTVTPSKPNAWKFELFIHNFLPFCESGKLGVMKVKREEEFGPVKNAEGVDSP
jgi:UDP-N-acetylglucosamine pyrophosphorylase